MFTARCDWQAQSHHIGQSDIDKRMFLIHITSSPSNPPKPATTKKNSRPQLSVHAKYIGISAKTTLAALSFCRTVKTTINTRASSDDEVQKVRETPVLCTHNIQNREYRKEKMREVREEISKAQTPGYPYCTYARIRCVAISSITRKDTSPQHVPQIGQPSHEVLHGNPVLLRPATSNWTGAPTLRLVRRCGFEISLRRRRR